MAAKTKRILTLEEWVFLKLRPVGIEGKSCVAVAKACIQAAKEARAAKVANPKRFYWKGPVMSYALTRRNQILGLEFSPADAHWRSKEVA